MSDDRISPTPNEPRCPVCATGFAATPGTSCPACGRGSLPLPVPPPEFDFRLRTERRRLDGPAWIVIGVVLSGGALLLSIGAPGILIPLLILTAPALIRTVRLSRGRTNERAYSFFTTFLAALGVSLLTGLAAGAACFGVCVATILIGGSGLGTLGPGFIAGGITAVVVFIGLFILLWPRDDTSSKYDPGED